MKQHITVEQLQQLSPEQLERLGKWWKPEEGDWVIEKGYIDTDLNETSVLHGFNTDRYIKQKCLPLLSIGQCIELLTENKDSNATIERNYTDNGLLWFVDSKGGAESPELIDALWESVKEAL